ncbi:MAG: hypothetical protein ACOX05_01740 [Bacillota bacterium]
MYALHHFGWRPTEFTGLGAREKAAVIAMINYQLGEERKAQARLGRC